MNNIEVVAAVIIQDGKVLCVQRPKHVKEYISLQWEFPGGKVELGENREEALVREIQEELAAEIHELQYLMTVEHSYLDFHLTMHTYSCALKNGEITLREHVDMKWLAPEELDQLDWAAADLPVMEGVILKDIFKAYYIYHNNEQTKLT